MARKKEIVNTPSKQRRDMKIEQTGQHPNAVSTEQEFNPGWLLLDNQLCFAAYALSREITGLYRPFLEPLGITYTQYITMMVLWETPVVSMKTLGERLFLDSGTLTPLLKKLVQMDFVEKERDPSDERSVLVRLTDAGWALRSEVMRIPAEILCGTGVDEETAVRLREVMKKMATDIRDLS